MDNRVLPFATPGAGNEEDEAVAILAHVAEKLLEDHRASVERIRRYAVLYSRIAFGVAVVAWCFFLVLDFETAPIPLLIVPVVLALACAGLGIMLRTRLVDPDRFLAPRIRYARKYHWQWLAVAVDDERVLLWDTLSEDALALEFPQNAPRRPDWLMREPDSLKLIAEEQMIVSRLGDTLQAWQAAPDRVLLPQVKENQAELVEFFRNLPRASRRLEAAPAFPPLRPIEEGQKEMERLVQLQQSLAIVRRQLDAWEEAIPPFREQMVKALGITVPHMEAPPSPPSAHPSGDVEMVLGSLDLLRTNVFEPLNIPLQNDLTFLQEDLNRRLKVLEDDWQRERNIITMSKDPYLSSLQRSLEEAEQRLIPQAEQALRESRTKQREAAERMNRNRTDLDQKRKELLMAGGSSSGPKASDERKRSLQSSIDQMESNKSTFDMNVQTWDQMVAQHQQILDRERFNAERISKDYKEQQEQRNNDLRRVDSNFEIRRDTMRDEVQPKIEAMEADLTYFKNLIGDVAQSLSEYRVDLIAEDEATRPYTQVVQAAQVMIQKKQQAIKTWAQSVLTLIRERRQTIDYIIEQIDRYAVQPNFGVPQARMMQVPVWYVEAQTGQVSLFPWQPPTALKDKVYLLAPFEEHPKGVRMGLVGPSARFMRPVPYLQQRLDQVLKALPSRKLLEQIRQGGRLVTMDPKRIRDTSLACQIPLAMNQMVVEYNSEQRAALIEAGVVVPSFIPLNGATPAPEPADDVLLTGKLTALTGKMPTVGAADGVDTDTPDPVAAENGSDAPLPDDALVLDAPAAADDDDDWLQALTAASSDDGWQAPKEDDDAPLT
jgi:hypothetical protein